MVAPYYHFDVLFTEKKRLHFLDMALLILSNYILTLICHFIFDFINFLIFFTIFFYFQLHMVSENDFAVIIETRKPQFVYTSEPHNVIDDTKAADIMTGATGLNLTILDSS